MSKDKGKARARHGHQPDDAARPEAARPEAKGPDLEGAAGPAPTLPGTRAELLALHADTRRRRNSAPLGSPEHRAAVDLIGRIEVEIARIERAMDPPLV